MSTSLAASGGINMDEITNYVQNLKFRSAAFGGADRAAVQTAIQELYGMFTRACIGAADQIDRLRNDLGSARACQERLEREADALRREKESMAQTIALQIENAARAVEAESRYRQNETDCLRRIDELRARNQELESALDAQKAQYQRELELARSDIGGRSETLEEIYMEARRSRDEMLEQARQEAGDLLQKAEDEIAARWKTENESYAQRQADAEALLTASRSEAEHLTAAARQEAEQIISGAREKARRLVADAQADAEQIARQAQREAEESRERCQSQEAAAREALDSARAEAAQIIASAKAAYTREREKYDVLLTRLGRLRAKTVEDVRGDIARLNELVLDMTSPGGEMCPKNTGGPAGTDTDGGPPAAAAGTGPESGEASPPEQEAIQNDP